DRIAKLPLLAENVLAALSEKERAARRGIRDLGLELAEGLALGGGHVVGALHRNDPLGPAIQIGEPRAKVRGPRLEEGPHPLRSARSSRSRASRTASRSTYSSSPTRPSSSASWSSRSSSRTGSSSVSCCSAYSTTLSRQ